jgi:ubiquinone biosynthesis protein Coq4
MFLNFSDQLTLKKAYSQLPGDLPQDIPFLVWLFENPDSPLPFPGKISLKSHDYLHLILDLDLSCQSEAFVVGFTMGNDVGSHRVFITLFKLVARFLYPQKYRFYLLDIQYFGKGLRFGQDLPRKNLNACIFEDFKEDTLKDIRGDLEINIQKLRQLLGQ